MPKKFPVVVAELKKNAKERIRVTLDLFRGTPILSVRVWYQDEENTWKPGRQGLAMDARKARRAEKATKRGMDKLSGDRIPTFSSPTGMGTM